MRCEALVIKKNVRCVFSKKVFLSQISSDSISTSFSYLNTFTATNVISKGKPIWMNFTEQKNTWIFMPQKPFYQETFVIKPAADQVKKKGLI